MGRSPQVPVRTKSLSRGAVSGAEPKQQQMREARLRLALYGASSSSSLSSSRSFAGGCLGRRMACGEFGEGMLLFCGFPFASVCVTMDERAAQHIGKRRSVRSEVCTSDVVVSCRILCCTQHIKFSRTTLRRGRLALSRVLVRVLLVLFIVHWSVVSLFSREDNWVESAFGCKRGR